MTGEAAKNHTIMHLEPVPAKLAVSPFKPLLPTNGYALEKSFYLALLILFLLFLHSKVPEILKRFLLNPIKFTSIYVIVPHSFRTVAGPI